MKKFIETMAAFVVAFVLVGTMVGCGQAAPDQGEVDTSQQTSPEDMEKNMKEQQDKSNEGAGSGGDGGGGGAPTPPGGGGAPTPPGGGGDAPTAPPSN